MLRNLLQRRLRMEILEDKRPLAANLFAEVIDGDLVITGDAGDNRLQIRGAVPDNSQYEILNVAGGGSPFDTINGIPFDLDHFFSGVTGDIIINLGEGSDWVVIEAANGVDILEIPGDVRIDVGGGDDRIALGLSNEPLFDDPIQSVRPLDIAGDLVIEGGEGTNMTWISSVLVGDDFRYTDSQGDAFLSFVSVGVDPEDAFESEFGDDFSVITGGSGDEIGLEDINVGGDLLVSVAGGDDSVALFNVDVEGSTLASLGAGTNLGQFEFSNLGTSLTVLGSGSNDVFITGVVTSTSVMVLTGSGSDMVALQSVQTGTAIVTTGSADDQLFVLDSVFDNLLVTLGGGADTLTMGGTTVEGLALLLGGAGVDTLVVAGANDIALELTLSF